ncbi:IS1-like element transposase [Candidiatus Paracoxiella cheracis]|uniref:IS1-like element transposase n=1 Tax=Candidiatus Paracoxiella cheracis TaxID=3405120 RepID=UPI003BF4FFA2
MARINVACPCCCLHEVVKFGVRDTARVLRISINTVIGELKKRVKVWRASIHDF